MERSRDIAINYLFSADCCKPLKGGGRVFWEGGKKEKGKISLFYGYGGGKRKLEGGGGRGTLIFVAHWPEKEVIVPQELSLLEETFRLLMRGGGEKESERRRLPNLYLSWEGRKRDGWRLLFSPAGRRGGNLLWGGREKRGWDECTLGRWRRTAVSRQITRRPRGKAKEKGARGRKGRVMESDPSFLCHSFAREKKKERNPTLRRRRPSRRSLAKTLGGKKKKRKKEVSAFKFSQKEGG